MLSLLAVGFSCGCGSTRLNTARANFYLGRYDAAVENLNDISDYHGPDRVLLLMERGTILQYKGDYQASTRDWIEAQSIIEQLDYYDISQGSSSLIINDNVKAFRGAPYERTLMRSFTAKSYLAMSMWDDAAVEARNIAIEQEKLNGYPDDAYSRYLAGFCFEMIRDFNGSLFQYRAATNMPNGITVNTDTGQIITPGQSDSELKAEAKQLHRGELVCFIGIGRSPREYGAARHNYKLGSTPYAEIYSGDKRLGRSYLFTDTQTLLTETEKRKAALQAAKDVTRIVIKESISHAIEKENELLGGLVRLLLFSMEVPDDRRWETLPRWLHIARVPCDPNASEFTIKFHGAANVITKEKTLSSPITRRGSTLFSFCRDL